MGPFNRFIVLCFLFLLLSACSPVHQTAATRHIPPGSALSNELIAPSVTAPAALTKKRRQVVKLAVNSIGRPYKWGGQSPDTGFDCSGLVSYTHQKVGISMPRTAKSQYLYGQAVPPGHLKPADLVFFNHTKALKSCHVGIYIGNGRFIHSPGKGRTVTYGRLDNPYFRKHFIGSRTYL